MKVLTGDTYSKLSSVASIPFPQMAKRNLEKCSSLFKSVELCDFLKSDDCPHTDMETDESQLAEDLVVPLPREHETNLAVEEQHIFENQIFIDLAPGSGDKNQGQYLLGDGPLGCLGLHGARSLGWG